MHLRLADRLAGAAWFMMTLTGSAESGEPEKSLCGLSSFSRLPGFVYMIAGIPRETKEGKLSACNTFVTAPSAKASHMGKPRFKDWKK